MPYILGIIGSHRIISNSEIVLTKIGNIIKNKIKNVKIDIFKLAKLNIQLCDGCLTCEHTFKCHIKDDMTPIYDLIVKADLIIISTPVYNDNVPALLKNFLDRLNPLISSEGLKNKKLALIVTGQLTGKEGQASRRRVIEYFKDFCEITGMKLVATLEFSARLPGEIKKTEKFEEKCNNFAEKIINIINGGN